MLVISNMKAWFNPPPSLNILLKTLEEMGVAFKCERQQLPFYLEMWSLKMIVLTRYGIQQGNGSFSFAKNLRV
jgi:hypothetical protein